MKNILKICVLAIVTLCACNDPYENSTYQVYGVNPVSSYMETRPETFSEWIKILKYADLFNAVNQASQSFTVFAPNNEAVKSFFEKKKVDSIQQLGKEYARNLAQYHIIADSIALDKLIVGGKLEEKTLSEDHLFVYFDDSSDSQGGINSLYINKEAHIIEPSITVSNGYVYVLNSVLSPLVETVYERVSMENKYAIFKSALEMTTWKDSLNKVYDEVKNPNGIVSKQKRNYTLLAVSDATFQLQGIRSINDLITKLAAGTDYANAENALFKYVGYHALEGSYGLADLQKFDDGTSKIWGTLSGNNIFKVSQESDGKYYINYKGGEGVRTQFLEQTSDVQAKNGILHEVDAYMPVFQSEEPAKVFFDFCNYQVLASYIATKGTPGQLYQTVNATNEYRTEVTYASCYATSISPSGVGSTSSYNYVDYFTVKTGNNWTKCMYNDQLILNIGYTGSIAMQTPIIVAGKYKVTLCMGYATSMNFIRTMTEGSNGGQMKFSFDNEKSVTVAPYTSITTNALDTYNSVIYDEIEFTKTGKHNLKIVVMDPAASTHAKFRIQFDYLLFEPINE